MNEESDMLDVLAYRWECAKADEDSACKKRIAIEKEILELKKDLLKEEGSSTAKTDYFKITITAKLDRKLDDDEWAAIAKQMPENLRPVKMKAVLDIPKLRALEAANPEIFKLASKAITVKPAKTAIKVERI